MFFAAQFVNFFAWSQLGTITAASGAKLLLGLDLNAGLLLVLLIFITAGMNLFVGSASAKWALMAPVFVPMLYLLGVSPEATQVAYRIGDSTTNVITPLIDRKSTRLNSSHVAISYAVFCLKKKNRRHIY